MPFQSLYQILRDEEICLLTIHSQAHSTLENAYLKDDPPYVAISYCWGDAHDLCNVRVNGYLVSLRRQVSAMLGSLYHRHRATRVWLDMVCIYYYRTTMKDLKRLRGLRLCFMRGLICL